MPDTLGEQQSWATTALEELRSNLEYARELVHGGQFLENLKVGAFDVADLYRAAWVQAVSALDHWVHRELYERALGFALNIEEERPARFLKLEVPMQLFENVHHHDGDFRESFDEYLRTRFGYLSFQAPDKIKQALGHVTDKQLWPGVAAVLANKGDDEALSTQASVVACLGEIVQRRHKIAHEADRDPEDGKVRLAISHHDANRTIDRIERIANAVAEVLGSPPAAVVQARPVPVSAVSVAAGVPPKQARYLRYWTEFKPVVERHGWTTAQPQPQNWWNMPGGVTGTTWALSFSRFGCRSELYFEHPNPAVNLARWQLLADRRDEINARFGDGLIFDELPQNKGCRIETRLYDVTVEQESRWPDIRDWMEDTQARLRAAVAAAGGVPSIMG
jgi:hypothetical protein